MLGRVCAAMLLLAAFMFLALTGCNGDDDDTEGRIAFSAITGSTSSIFVADLDADVVRQVVIDGVDPAYEPFGDFIAFARGNNIFLVEDDDTLQDDDDLVQVTNRSATGAFVADTAFNLDSSVIAFTSIPDVITPVPDVRVISVSGGTERIVAVNAEDPTFNPQTDEIAFVRGVDIYVVDFFGGLEQNITNNTDSIVVSDPVFSSDGDTIFFTATAIAPGAIPEIRAIDIDGTNPRTVITNASSPTIRPNGDRLAFVRDRDIFSIDFTGNDLEVETTGDFVSGDQISWGGL